MVSVIAKVSKDPDEVLPYVVDWRDTTVGPWLETADSIDTSDWDVEAGINEGTGAFASTNDSDTATIWLDGGTIGETYLITNTITTTPAPAKTAVRTFAVTVKDK